MDGMLPVVVFLGLYFVLQLWVLPRLGIRT